LTGVLTSLPPQTRDLTCVYHLIDSVDVETTRQELMRNATAIVRRGGSAALNFRDLGHSVGVKSSTVHYYFPTKSDLLKEIASEYTTMFLEALEDGLRDSGSFREDMLLLVDLFVGAQGEKLSCLCGMLATEADLLDPAVKTTVNQFFAALQEWVIRRARLRAVATPGGLAPATFARLLISLLEGALLLSRLHAHKASLAAARKWIGKVT
jgi:TetR/AcrR family transcriptional regulator, transcriptional repressor for nem operon